MKALSRYLATPLVLIGGLLSFGWLLVAILAPLIAPYDPLQTIQPLMRPLNSGPNGEFFLLGTDMLGRDIFSRLIWGAQTVVIYSTLATLTAYVFGLSLGLVAGYAGGRTDAVLCYLANVVLSFPVLVLYIVIIVVIGASPLNIVIAVTFSSAPAIFRIVRAITIGTLGFLGLGLPPPTPDWGGMVNEGRGMAIAFPHLVIFPCIAISSLTLGLSLLADGLREVNDAKERQA